MENKITIVYCTQKLKEELGEFNKHIQETCDCNVQLLCVSNQESISLSYLYADMVEADFIDTDVVVFIHDDIEFLKKGWGREILRLFKENEEYGIIGVAGSAQFDSDAAWWGYEKRYGQVLHRHEGKSWLTAFSPLLDKDLEEVAVVDGLFIALNRKRIKENFSKDIEGFDFYDIDFCLSNLGKCKIGVTTNIRVAHNSIGKLRDSWHKNREKINKKFGNLYPIDISDKKWKKKSRKRKQSVK